MPVLHPLPRRFYSRSALRVARDLVGCLLVHRRRRRFLVGRIVETEAYVGPHDLACHASHGRTARTDVMFGPPGHAYVYLIYGMHHCLNVVTGREGYPAAVLLRALEPVQNIRMSTSGPGRLTRAMGIDRRHNRADLCSGDLFLARPDRPRGRVVTSPRVGVEYAGQWAKEPSRFFEIGNAHVSRGDGVRAERHGRSRRTRDMQGE
jgi:DNA-3-methyladenine glycosylase